MRSLHSAFGCAFALVGCVLPLVGCGNEAPTNGGPTGGASSDTGGTGSDTGGSTQTGGSAQTGGVGGTGADGSGGASGGTSNASGGSSSCTPTASCTPDPLPSSGDVHQDCVDRINQFRVGCWCQEPLERWTEGEACADEQAAYDAARDEAHAGFSDGICESGWGQNECPGWNSEEQIIEGCLQMMYDEGPPPSESCDGSCFQEHGHFINMTDPDFSRVACGFYTTESGDVWSVQNFAN